MEATRRKGVFQHLSVPTGELTVRIRNGRIQSGTVETRRYCALVNSKPKGASESLMTFSSPTAKSRRNKDAVEGIGVFFRRELVIKFGTAWAFG